MRWRLRRDCALRLRGIPAGRYPLSEGAQIVGNSIPGRLLIEGELVVELVLTVGNRVAYGAQSDQVGRLVGAAHGARAHVMDVDHIGTLTQGAGIALTLVHLPPNRSWNFS